MSQRDDESEIETRLRAALMARSEQVTHQSLRPGVVPGTRAAQEATAVRAKSRGTGWSWNLSWRGLLVPSMVMASLVLGLVVGVAIPRGGSTAVGAGASGGVSSTPTAAPTTAPTTPATSATIPAATGPVEQTFGGVSFQPQSWTVAKVTATTACVLPAGHVAPDPEAKLPCGVDSLMITSDVSVAAWPVSAVKDKAGWWPAKVVTLADIPCPGKPAATVKTSAVFRADALYKLAQTTTAAYQEWSVTCSDGSGVQPKLWQLAAGAASGTSGPTTSTVVTAISASAHGDREMLEIVASMHA